MDQKPGQQGEGRKKVRLRHPKYLYTEFMEFYALLWQKSWKLTVGLTIGVPVSVYDEIHGFVHDRGTLYHIWLAIKPLLSFIN